MNDSMEKAEMEDKKSMQASIHTDRAGSLVVKSIESPFTKQPTGKVNKVGIVHESPTMLEEGPTARRALGSEGSSQRMGTAGNLMLPSSRESSFEVDN